MSNITGDDGSFSSGHSVEEIHGSAAAAGPTSSSTGDNSNGSGHPPLSATAKKKRSLPGTPGNDGSFSSGHSVEEIHGSAAAAAGAGPTSSSTGDNSNGSCHPPLSATAKKKRNLSGTPDPTAEVVALSPTTLMAKNSFFCEVCNKGFQRDQNLQLHRRGHNLPWMLKQKTSAELQKKVFICPEASCVHHNPARALGDLTRIKKHYSRKHGEKKWKCDNCSKKYAVQSDWEAHQKTCCTREYKCDCGTIFSRRDGFLTHRAFCDALTEKNIRVVQKDLSSLNLGSNSQNQFQNNMLLMMPPSEFDYYDPKGTLESIHEELAPTPFKPMNSFSAASGGMFSTSSGTRFGGPKCISSPSSSLQPSSNSSSCFDRDQVSGLCHMSVTALLQKAAQLGAATASNINNSPTMQKSFGLSFGSNNAGANGGGLINNHLFRTVNESSSMNDTGSATPTLDFLGIRGSHVINVHEQHRREMEAMSQRRMQAMSQRRMQAMNPFKQQLSPGESSLEKPTWDHAYLVPAKDAEVAAVELLDPVLGHRDQKITLGVGILTAKCIVEDNRKRSDMDYVLAQIQTLGSPEVLQDPHGVGVDKETDYKQVIANARAEKILARQQVAIVQEYIQSSEATLSAISKGEEGARETIESSQEMINNFQKIGISAKKLQSSAGRVEEAMQAVMAAADAKIEATKRKATI